MTFYLIFELNPNDGSTAFTYNSNSLQAMIQLEILQIN